jgi:hypothetical protein
LLRWLLLPSVGKHVDEDPWFGVELISHVPRQQLVNTEELFLSCDVWMHEVLLVVADTVAEIHGTVSGLFVLHACRHVCRQICTSERRNWYRAYD